MRIKKYIGLYAQQIANWALIRPVDWVPRRMLQGEAEIWIYEPGMMKKAGIISERHLQEHRYIPNTVVDGGEIWITELLGGEDTGGTTLLYASAGDLGLGLQYISVGESGTGTTSGTYELLAIVTTNPTIVVDNDIKDTPNFNELVVTATFGTNDGNGSLLEAGIFSGTTAPGSKTDTTSRMFNRTTFGQITKTTSFDLTLQWTIKIGTMGA